MARETAPAAPGDPPAGAQDSDAASATDDDAVLDGLRRALEQERAGKAEALAQQAEAREQQTATGAIVRVLGASSGDAQPVFDAIVEEAVRVCGAVGATLSRVDGGELVGLAVHAAESWAQASGPMPVGTH